MQILRQLSIVNFITLGHYTWIMKPNIIITLICSFLYGGHSFAQEFPKTYFLKNNELVKKRDDADHIMVVSAPDASTGLYDIKELYLNNTVKLIGKTSQPDHKMLEGKCETFYPTGQKDEVVNYDNNSKEGDAYKYYPNGKLYTHKKYTRGEVIGADEEATALVLECRDSTGKALVTDGNGSYMIYSSDLKNILEEGAIKDGSKDGKWKGENGDKDNKVTFEEEYNAGKLVVGKATDKDNKQYTYKERAAQPQFLGGSQGLNQYLATTIRYPMHAMESRIQGTVIVNFAVEKDGKLSNFKVMRTPDRELSDEAIRVLKASPYWLPAMKYGIPVKGDITVPVRFVYGQK
jgi:TonB family protein